MYIPFILTVLLLLLPSACSAATQAPPPTETAQPTIAAIFTDWISTFTPENTPTPVLLADTFFTGCALLDKNANGLMDSEDAPVGGIRFTITLAGGMGFGDLTSEKDGCALVMIPGELSRESWPIVAQMETPQTFTYVPIGDAKITLAYPDSRADFLFSQP